MVVSSAVNRENPEVSAALAVRGQVAAPGRYVLARQLAEARHVVREALEFRIGDRVWAVGGDHVALPAGFADRAVVFQRVQRRLGGGQRLDVEGLKRLRATIIGALAESPRYRCVECGYDSRQFNWQCPSCKRWDTAAPLDRVVLGLGN